MIYIWRAQKWQSKVVMHISVDVYGAAVPAPWSAAGLRARCGVAVKFNRFAYGPDHGYPYPVCKNCLRSCVDERVAA